MKEGENRMYKYVIKRILFTIPVLLGATLLVYAIMYLTDPGHYGQAGGYRGAEPQAGS